MAAEGPSLCCHLQTKRPLAIAAIGHGSYGSGRLLFLSPQQASYELCGTDRTATDPMFTQQASCGGEDNQPHFSRL